MWPVTERFNKAVRGDHVVVTKVEILEGDEVIFDLTNSVLGGTVNVSRSEIERTASGVSFVDRDGTLSPRDVDDLLAPVGNQIRLWRGIVYDPPPSGKGLDVELVPLITARFAGAKVSYPYVELSELSDRAWIVQGAKNEDVLVIPKNTLVVDAIGGILSAAYPGAPTDFPVLDEVTNAMVLDVESDPWQICQELAANTGHRLSFDPMGVARMAPEADVDGPVAWLFDDSTARIDELNMALSGSAASWQGVGFNSVTVVGENSDLAAAVRARARDLDPLSPTYYGGKFGRRTAPLVRDEKLQSQGQAQLRATRDLQAQLGISQAVTLPSMVHPAFAPNDVLAANLTYGLAQPLIVHAGVLDQFGIPMRANDSSILEMRARRIAVTE